MDNFFTRFTSPSVRMHGWMGSQLYIHTLLALPPPFIVRALWADKRDFDFMTTHGPSKSWIFPHEEQSWAVKEDLLYSPRFLPSFPLHWPSFSLTENWFICRFDAQKGRLRWKKERRRDVFFLPSLLIHPKNTQKILSFLSFFIFLPCFIRQNGSFVAIAWLGLIKKRSLGKANQRKGLRRLVVCCVSSHHLSYRSWAPISCS